MIVHWKSTGSPDKPIPYTFMVTEETMQVTTVKTDFFVVQFYLQYFLCYYLILLEIRIKYILYANVHTILLCLLYRDEVPSSEWILLNYQLGLLARFAIRTSTFSKLCTNLYSGLQKSVQ
jgi:hypothetical protein